nr:phospholipase A1 [Raoultella sp. NCTC 9187]
MRISLAWLLALVALPAGVLAQDAPINHQIHDTPAVRGSIIANLLQDHDNPFLLYPYESNYCSIRGAAISTRKAISSYDWAENARKDEVKFQLSLAFPLWRGILGDNSLLGASYTQKSWWQLSNSKESAPFRETNYEPQLFLGFATDYRLAGWTLRDMR